MRRDLHRDRAASDQREPPDLRFLRQPGEDELSVVLTGDSILYRTREELTRPAYAALFQMQRECDLAITNCELVFSDSGFPKPKDVAFAPPRIADEFVWQGIDMVSLANNHTMDLGPDGLLQTMRVLDGRGIAHAGAGADLAAALRPAVAERKGIRVGLLSFVTMASPVATDSAAADSSPGLAAIRGYPVRVPDSAGVKGRFTAPDDAALQRMERAIQAARREADFLVVAFHMHWGGRYDVDEGRRIIAHAAVDSGADLVVGHGPHVINPVERYRDRFIFYSLGNFFFHIYQGNRTADVFGSTWPGIRKAIYSFTTSTDYWEALAPRVILGRDGVHRIQVLPLAIDRDGNPYLPDAELGAAILEDFAESSKGMGANLQLHTTYAELSA